MVLGDLDSYMQKNEFQPPTYTIHKNKFKVDERLKYMLQYHKSPKGEHRQDNLYAAIFSLICPLAQGTYKKE